MVFSSLVFLFTFLPLIILLYYISKEEYRNYLLLIASLFFYAWGEPVYIVIMLISIIFNFIFGKKVYINSNVSNRKQWLIISIVFNVTMLGIFKYTGFFIENINNIFNLQILNPNIALPLGISFFTFQSMSYVIDVYKNDAKVQTNLFDLALYISLFPQLVAGPIVRYQTIADQIDSREHNLTKFNDGLSRFIVGLGKKVILSNSLGLIADSAFSLEISNLSTSSAWIGIIAYSLQIFFDFSGYSDMAIGLGKMFGFEFLENFNYPYISKSVGEFWRRWHISLGSWFRDYVYIPLGGNRKGTVRTYINLFIVWFLTGFWHGASWTFILWGLYFGILIILERLFLEKFLSKLHVSMRHIYLLLIVLIGWVFFRADNFSHAFEYIQTMMRINGGKLIDNYTYLYIHDYSFVLILSIILSTPIIPTLNNKLGRFKDTQMYYIIKSIVLMTIFFIVVIKLINSTYNPFLYFKF